MPECAGQLPFDASTNEAVHWHDYRKIARTGRKIGHVTVTATSVAELHARAALLAAELGLAAELNLEAVMQE
jgi:phosphoribosylaminoimidazole carboxylase (NCAIR synthetase)